MSRFLVVEGENYPELCAYLQQNGHDASSCPNEQIAFDLLAIDTFDFCVLDMSNRMRSLIDIEKSIIRIEKISPSTRVLVSLRNSEERNCKAFCEEKNIYAFLRPYNIKQIIEVLYHLSDNEESEESLSVEHSTHAEQDASVDCDSLYHEDRRFLADKATRDEENRDHGSYSKAHAKQLVGIACVLVLILTFSIAYHFSKMPKKSEDNSIKSHSPTVLSPTPKVKALPRAVSSDGSISIDIGF